MGNDSANNVVLCVCFECVFRTYVNYLMIYSHISINEKCVYTESIVGTQSILLTCVHER